ncbi:Flp pilus assembly protein CpaB [Novosphingobium sp. MW5]|nr:Flp pilus assembly protein CpaB [Novosphingobium sp. MW5]
MDKKKLLLLVGALVIAIGTALAARSLFAGASAPKAEAAQQAVPQGPKVLVAQRALPVGTIITADSISFQMWPKEMVQDAYFVEGEADMAKLLGTVVRYPVTAGQPLTQGSLVKPGDRGFLAAALGPGMRAITINVSARTGVAGFIFPGDHIDLMLTQAVRGEGEGQPLKATETILKNLRVLATDQATDSEVVDGKTVVREFRTVTLEVTPKIAEKIAVAETIGTLSLALRSIADNQAELERLVASGAVKIPTGVSKEEEERILTAAMNRPDESKGSFSTGGDVSRFQRSSMPVARTVAARTAVAGPASAAPAPGGFPFVRVGPVVRVTRGKVTTSEEIGK